MTNLVLQLGRVCSFGADLMIVAQVGYLLAHVDGRLMVDWSCSRAAADLFAGLDFRLWVGLLVGL